MNVGNVLTVKTSSSPSSPSFWSAVEEVVEPTEKKTGTSFISRIQHFTGWGLTETKETLQWCRNIWAYCQSSLRWNKSHLSLKFKSSLHASIKYNFSFYLWIRLSITWQRTFLDSHTAAQHTFSQVLNGFPYPPVECSGVSWTLEGQATLPVLHLPMVKCGRCYGVHKVLPQRTVQDHLFIRHASANQQLTQMFHILSLIELWLTCFLLPFVCFTCLSRSRSPRMRNWEKLEAGTGASSGGRRRHTPTLLRAPPSCASQPPLESSRVITTAFTRTM